MVNFSIYEDQIAVNVTLDCFTPFHTRISQQDAGFVFTIVDTAHAEFRLHNVRHFVDDGPHRSGHDRHDLKCFLATENN
jgi:hypothetical protein